MFNIFFSTIILFVAVLILWIRVKKYNISLLDFFNVNLFALVLWFMLRAFILAFSPALAMTFPSLTEFDINNYLPYALICIFLWMIFVFIGYLVIAQYKIKTINIIEKNYNIEFLYKLLLIVYIISLSEVAYNIVNNNYLGFVVASRYAGESSLTLVNKADTGYLGFLFNTILGNINDFSLICILTISIRYNYRYGITVIIFLTSIIEALISGTKGSLIFVLFILMALFYLYRYKYFTKLVIIAPLALVLIFSTVTTYRSLYSTTYNKELNYKQIDDIVIESLTNSRSLVSDDEFWFRSIGDRFQGVDALTASIITIEEDNIDYVHGYTIYTSLGSSIPSFVWPSRPNINLGSWFPIKYLGYNPGYGTVVPMPRMVESYINFGLPGIMFFGFLFGVFMGYVKAKSNFFKKQTVIGVALYLFLLFNISLTVEKPFMQLFLLIKKVVIIYLFIYTINKLMNILKK